MGALGEDLSRKAGVALGLGANEQIEERIGSTDLLFRQALRELCPPPQECITNPVTEQGELTPQAAAHHDVLLAVETEERPGRKRATRVFHRPLQDDSAKRLHQRLSQLLGGRVERHAIEGELGEPAAT